MITKKLKLIVATTALALGGLSGFAFAKGHMGPKDPAKQALFAQKKAERLAKFDANKDGKLDDGERKVMHDERVEKRFAMLDTNKDGAITLDEMKAAPHGKHGRRGHHRGFGGPKTK